MWLKEMPRVMHPADGLGSESARLTTWEMEIFGFVQRWPELSSPPFIQNHCRITNMISSEITACFLYFFQEAVCLFWMSNNVLVLSQVSLSLNNLSSHRFWACNMATKMYLNGLLTERLFWNLHYNKLVSLCRERYTVVSAQRAEALFISQMGYRLMRLKSTKWIFTL